MMLQGYKDKDTTHVYLVMQWPHECKGGLVLLLIQSSNSRFMFGVRDKHSDPPTPAHGRRFCNCVSTRFRAV